MESLWENLEEPPINFEEFEEVFAKPVLRKKTSPEKEVKQKKVKKEVGCC